MTEDKFLEKPFWRTRADVVREFMDRKERVGWFSSPTNSMYGKKLQIQSYLEHWARTGEFGPDYNDKELVVAASTLQKTLDELYLPESKAEALRQFKEILDPEGEIGLKGEEE